MERLREEGQKENAASYDQSLRTFYEDELKFGRKGLGKFVAGKVAPHEQDEMERIRKAIEGQGLKLE